MKKRSSLPPKTSSENSPSDVTALVPSLDRNVEAIKKILGASDDIAFRSFLVGGELKAQLVYIPDMSDRLEMDNNVLKPLMGMPARNQRICKRSKTGFCRSGRSRRSQTPTNAPDS
ncbi:hypothetical protein [Paenibacillus macerans]|uniref:hypothetical protein n=1 Tax=Paenibacillus macerans TaxID=44252 RepID=UPI002DBB1B92|nr:hypothetical protein [Paenibacillus macerans]